MGADGPFRGGQVHVMAERCSTCIFRPGDPMHLGPGVLAEFIDANLEAQSALQCHQTLSYAPDPKPPAVCRGFYDHPHGGQSLPLKLARAMELVVFDELGPEPDAPPVN